MDRTTHPVTPPANPAAALRGRRVLVTAGPTWVRVDAVRVITTVFSGETGLAIARHLASCGADVTLWLGPGRARPTDADRAALRVVDFRYYEDLEKLVKEDDVAAFDAIVHSAAVADYRPVPAPGKIPSGRAGLTIELRPTEKLVDILRRRAPDAVLVKFKLETGITHDDLLAIAERSRARSAAELIVANLHEGMSATAHAATLLDETGQRVDVADKAALCRELAAAVALRLPAQLSR